MIHVDDYKDGLYWTNYVNLLDTDGNQPIADLSRILTGVTFYDETVSGDFCIGNVLGKRVRLSLSNHPIDESGVQPYNSFDFLNATATIWCQASYIDNLDTTTPVTVNLSIPKGEYKIISATTPDDVIELDAVDRTTYLDVPYTTRLVYPKTLKDIFFDALRTLGMGTEITDFDNSDLTVNKKPENCTFRNVLGWIAMMAGCNARFSNELLFEFVTYDKNAEVLDSDALSGYNLTVTTNPITVNGVKVINSDNALTQRGGTGNKPYFLVAKDNPFIDGNEDALADFLQNKFNGFSFKNFEGEFPCDPRLESHDPVKIKNVKGQIFQTVLTSVEFNAQGGTNLKCEIENPTINNADYKSDFDREVQAAREKMTEYENNYILFNNPFEVITTDGGNPLPLGIEQEFAVVKPVVVLVLTEILFTMSTTYSSTEEYDIYNVGKVNVLYYYDDMDNPIDTWMPKESFDDGQHVLNLIYPLEVVDINSHKWKIAITGTGGSVTIAEHKAQCTILGQGLVGKTWDGHINAYDDFNVYNFNLLKAFTDTATATLVAPEEANGSDSWIRYNFAMLKAFTDSASADKDMIAMYAGDGLTTVTDCTIPTNKNYWLAGSNGGTLVSAQVKDTTTVTVTADSGIEYQISYDGGTTWKALVNGEWVTDATMTASQLQAITSWDYNIMKLKAILPANAIVRSIVFHDAEIYS